MTTQVTTMLSLDLEHKEKTLAASESSLPFEASPSCSPVVLYMRHCLTTEKLEPGMAGILPSAWYYFS